MVDLWEAFGRMAVDDQFRQELYTACPVVTYEKENFPDKFKGIGLNIPSSNYDNVRNVVVKYMPDFPASMMALGEILMVLSSRKFRDLEDALADAIKTTHIGVAGFGRLYYIGLGCMLLDSNIRIGFANQLFDQYQYGQLQTGEKNSLRDLALAPTVTNSAVIACNMYWGTACTDYQTFYPGHLHPIVQAYPPK